METAMSVSKEQLKKVFRNYRRLSPKLMMELENLEFKLLCHKKHYILAYQIKGTQLIFPLPITASDRRIGRNFASLIYAKLKTAYQAA